MSAEDTGRTSRTYPDIFYGDDSKKRQQGVPITLFAEICLFDVSKHSFVIVNIHKIELTEADRQLVWP